MLNVDIGERLREVRGDASRAEFADSLGIHPQTLYMYEKGKRVMDVELIQRVCSRYDVSIEWLVMGIEPATKTAEVPSEEAQRQLREKDALIEQKDQQIKELKDELIEAQAHAIEAFQAVMQWQSDMPKASPSGEATSAKGGD